MKKELGFIGLGRMGLNMTTLLIEKGYRVVTVSRNEKSDAAAIRVGVEVVADYPTLKETLSPDRVVWLMVPSAAVDSVMEEVISHLDAGDTVIDGGNSFYQKSLVRHKALEEKQLNFLDCGTSGGMEGARNGASIMVGGKADVFAQHEHIFEALAAKDAYARVGNQGAGHFVKMVHNGIEYGMMGAIAEGMSVLHDNEVKFGIDLQEVLKPYEHESIITSKLVSWLGEAYDQGQIDAISGEVPTGETEFEMEHIIAELGEMKVLEAALEQRKASRVSETYLGKLVAAMRNQFGGHKVIKSE